MFVHVIDKKSTQNLGRFLGDEHKNTDTFIRNKRKLNKHKNMVDTIHLPCQLVMSWDANNKIIQ